MIKILDYLEQLGLSETEAKLYLTLLKMGPISIRELAETTKIKRTTAYLYIDQLIDKGLVVKIVRESKKLVEANTPEENLKHLVEKKLERAKQAESNLPEMMALLTKALPQKESTNEAEFRYYKGKHGVQKIYEEALRAKELRSYVKVEEPTYIFSNNVAFFQDGFEKNKKLKVWEIIYDSPNSTKDAQEIQTTTSNYRYKLMPKDLNLSSEDILIYDNTVAIINYKGNINSVVLKSTDYYNNSKKIFDFVWKILP